MRRDLLDVRREVGLVMTEGPTEPAPDDLPARRVGPDVLAVAQRREEDAALAVFAGPRGREGRALVAVVHHALGLLDEDHVKVFGEVLQGVPLLQKNFA